MVAAAMRGVGVACARNAERIAERVEWKDIPWLAGKGVDHGLQGEHAGGNQRQPSAQSRPLSRHRPISISALRSSDK
ncbi:hypothetical protein [Sinorhizobium meliloti]|uniref:hypothetical protein n=1 Tax=Rhizobium meliloti TaxID=382 RepID=UPI0002DA1573|nr:hypothetical protein [Sinorhizobium meliloti]